MQQFSEDEQGGEVNDQQEALVQHLQLVHPDQDDPRFRFAEAWCKTCGVAFRVHTSGARWYSVTGAGPYCSQACLDLLGGIWRVCDTEPYDTAST